MLASLGDVLLHLLELIFEDLGLIFEDLDIALHGLHVQRNLRNHLMDSLVEGDLRISACGKNIGSELPIFGSCE